MIRDGGGGPFLRSTVAPALLTPMLLVGFAWWVDHEFGRVRAASTIRQAAEERQTAAIDVSWIKDEMGLLTKTRRAFPAHAVRTEWLVLIGFTIISVVLAAALFGLLRAGRARHRLAAGEAAAAARYHAIFHAADDALVLLDPEGRIETVNPALTRLLGYRREELERRDLCTLLRLPTCGGGFLDRIGLCDGRLAQPLLFDRQAVHRDGHAVPVDVALGLMELDDRTHVIASMRDISARRSMERMKDEFISTVSHELRTPLTSVVGALGLLRAGGGGELGGEARELVEIAESNSRRLIRLINDILDVDRIGSGRLHFDLRPLDLRDVAEAAVRDAAVLADEKGVAIVAPRAPEALRVEGDGERLIQVASNLLANAVRQSPCGGRVMVEVRRDGRRAVLSVDDQGPGVPPTFRDRMFERFSQADGAQGGSGLGLAISREIVARHGGAIWFEDRDGGGARFAVALDLVEDDRDLLRREEES